MKINWGTGIAIFYICFMAIMISMVVKSAKNNVHLVQENYYEKDLNYESFRQKRQNAKSLKTPLQVAYNATDKNIVLIFPVDMKDATGQVALFRPSNKNLDQQYKIIVKKNGQMTIPINDQTEPGLWKLHINWSSQQTEFYSEESIII